MLRARFYIDFEDCDNDYRPVVWPIKYPYWCSGENDSSFVLVAFVENEDELYKQWPEAHDVESEEVDKVTFSSRFQRPEWYKE